MEKIGKKIASLDSFAPSIALNFEGRDRFQTTRGGLITVLIYALVLWQTTALVQNFVARTEPTISQYSKSYPTDQEKQYFSDRRQQLMFKFDDQKGVIYDLDDLDPRIASFSFEISNKITGMTPIELEPCDALSSFQGMHIEDLNNLQRKVEGYQCIKHPEKVFMRGQYSDSDLDSLVFRLAFCSKESLPVGQECQSYDSIEQFFKGKTLKTRAIRSWVDFEDFENTIKSEATVRERYTMTPDTSVVIDFLFTAHKFTDEQSRVQILGQPVEHNFLNMLKDASTERATPGYSSISLNFTLKPDMVVSQRTVYSSLQLLGDAGGLYGSMMLIGSVLHSLLTNSEHEAQMLTHFYHVDRASNPLYQSPLSSRDRCLSTLWLQTSLRWLVSCFLKLWPSRCQRLKARLKVQECLSAKLERSLDIRSLINLQGLVIAHNRFFFDKRHRKMLGQQKYAKMVSHASDSDEKVLFSFDLEPPMQTDMQSPRSIRLRQGLIPTHVSEPQRQTRGDQALNLSLDATVELTDISRDGAREQQMRARIPVKTK